MHMKSKRLIAPILVLALVLSMLPAMFIIAAAAEDPLRLPETPGSTFSITAGGKEITVNAWEDVLYVANPVDINFHFPPIPGVPAIETTHLLNIYAPENATDASPVILLVDNGGWFSNVNPVKLKEGDVLPAGSEGSRLAAIGEALQAGYVVVSYSCRGRNDSPNDGEFLGHSPATMTDTKAVIRYLRYNDSVIPGDSEKIVITGTSGGGALSSVVAASGNSPDYYESLYEIGAAGMTSADKSVISDAVFAVIAYCPITDLPNADQAYEWIYSSVRMAYKEAGLGLDDVNPSPNAMGAPENTDQVFGDSVLAASAELAADYIKYINALGLKDADGNLLKADDGTFLAAIKALMEAGAEKELSSAFKSSDKAPSDGDYDWLTITDEKAIIDWDAFLYWIGTECTGLKTAPAFSNRGTPNQHPQLNEDNIFGARDQAYSPFEFWSWDNHIAEDTTVGKNNTDLDWDAYLATDAGKVLLTQLKMTNPIPYLQSGSDCDNAPYWYVRHGMADRDTSFAVEATLYFALINASGVEDVNFNFAWLKGHGGDYDVPEAYTWLAGVLTEGKAPPVFTDVPVDAWYFDDLMTAYESGLIAGKTATTFVPDGNITNAEAVTFAARIHQLYTDGEITLKNAEDSAWYDSFVAYAKENGIISDDYDWGAPTTREIYMSIFANALPEEALAAINNVDDDAIPDVPMTHPNAGAIYMLYRAGILQGVDDAHNCMPGAFIKRCDIAAILNRMMDSSVRVSFSL